MVSYIPKKLGRRYAYIELVIRKKDRATRAAIEEIKEESPLGRLIKLLPEEHRGKKTIINAIARAYRRNGMEYCKRNILYANEFATQNYRVFIIKSLQHDWGLGWWEEREEKEAAKDMFEKIKNAKLKVGDQIYETDKNGFLYVNNGVIPPARILDLLKEGKIELVN